jgi:7-cyano-7-deazaguanine synthase
VTLADDGALVLLSGGQDSATCLAWALDRFARVETLAFDYGQRHAVELACRERLRDRIGDLNTAWATRLGEDHFLDLSVLGAVSETALTRDIAIEAEAGGLPNTFVPGRNILFLTLAAALAYRRGLRHIVGGMCEADYSGYPDCRDEAIRALEAALNLGMDARFAIDTPLMRLDKAATWALAERLGGQALVDLIVEESHSCYEGVREARHEWGYGCGACPACELRAKGFAAWRDTKHAGR